MSPIRKGSKADEGVTNPKKRSIINVECDSVEFRILRCPISSLSPEPVRLHGDRAR